MRLKLILIFLLVMNFSSASILKISPQEINLNVSVDKSFCVNISIGSSENEDFIFASSWSNIESKNLEDFTFSLEDKKIIEYSRPIIQSNQKNTICFIMTEEGQYYGALKFRSIDQNYGIGSWINVNAEDRKINFKLIEERINMEIVSLSFILFILIILLFWIAYKL